MNREDLSEGAAAARPEAVSMRSEAAGPLGDDGGLPPEVAGPQAESAVTQVASPERQPAVLDAAQRELLRAVLNRIVPPRDDLAGAGDLEVGTTIERQLAVSIRLRRLFLDGLAEIGVAAQRFSGAEFVTLAAATQTAVLQDVEQRKRAFFVALVEHTYRGYYTLPQVQTAVGFEARPPQPLGHQLPPFDPALLDRQRQRAPFWRAAESDILNP